MSTHKNRVKMTVSGTPGTGTITLSAASSGYQSFATAYGANATVDILIEEGTAWEVARDCTYTNSGTTVTRGTFEASSTGSAVSFTSAAVVSEILTAEKGNYFENVAINGGFVYATADGANVQTLTLSAFNRMRGNSDSPSNGVLRTEVADERGWWDAGIARFQPTVSGKYLVVVGAQITNTGSGVTTTSQTVLPAIYKNGAIFAWGARVEGPEGAAIIRNMGALATAIVTLNGSSDYVEPYVFAANPFGTSPASELRNIAHGCFFQARYLGQ